MQILVTEATSSLAHHLLPMLASGDVIHSESLELVLCDCADVQSEVQEVAQDLKDCVYPCLADVKVTGDFCEACTTADVVLVLPRQLAETAAAGPLSVDVSYSMLSQMDFHSLDAGIHPCRVAIQDTFTVKCRGVMSAANSICTYIRDLHRRSLRFQAIETEIQTRHEEAEFGCLRGDISNNLETQWQCDYHLGMGCYLLVFDIKTLLVLVNTRDIKDAVVDREDVLDNILPVARLFARL